MIASKEINCETASGPAIAVITQLNGVQAMKLFIRLANKFGGALSAYRTQGATGLIASAIEKLDPDEYERIQNELLAKLVLRWPDANNVDSNAVRNLGEHFTGQPFELGRLVFAALELNFGNFLDRLLSAAAQAGVKIQAT